MVLIHVVNISDLLLVCSVTDVVRVWRTEPTEEGLQQSVSLAVFDALSLSSSSQL